MAVRGYLTRPSGTFNDHYAIGPPTFSPLTREQRAARMLMLYQLGGTDDSRAIDFSRMRATAIGWRR
jgi:hypothetical protein